MFHRIKKQISYKIKYSLFFQIGHNVKITTGREETCGNPADRTGTADTQIAPGVGKEISGATAKTEFDDTACERDG